MQDFADAYYEDMAKMDSEQYYPCCGKTICKGCAYSFMEIVHIVILTGLAKQMKKWLRKY
jgi:hypothetical protein